MIEFGIDLSALRDARAALLRAERGLQIGMRRGLHAAGEIGVEGIRREAPVGKREAGDRKGPHLRDTVSFHLSGSGAFLTLTFRVSAAHARYVHDGTRPHKIRPKRAKTPGKRGPALRWSAGGGFAFAPEVDHPGTRPNPFAIRGLARVRNRMNERFAAEVWGGMRRGG